MTPRGEWVGGKVLWTGLGLISPHVLGSERCDREGRAEGEDPRDRDANPRLELYLKRTAHDDLSGVGKTNVQTIVVDVDMGMGTCPASQAQPPTLFPHGKSRSGVFVSH